ISKFNFKVFKATLYAEDILPKGLYGTDLQFSNASQSYKFIFGLSTYFDFYDLSRYILGATTSEVFFPGQFNGKLQFTVFDLPSFGFQIYANGGILLPFSYNFSDGSSAFQTLAAKNPAALASTLAINMGFLLRVKKFSIALEFLVDSAINKVSYYDALYDAQRDDHNSTYTAWMTDLSSRDVGFRDYNFGFRFFMMYELQKYIHFESSYQITLTSAPGNTIPINYYDKIFFSLNLDSKDRWKVAVGYNLQLYFQEIGTSIVRAVAKDYDYFFNNLLLATGLFVQPYSMIKLNFKFGMYPDQTGSSNLGTKFMFLIYADFYPKFSINAKPKK
ncbi:MAG: hypothetical protein MJB14_23265, partial [Spirochaetes bacterium]|nr:hypothetical protein [Spirochaetota bacterium]